MELTTNFKLKKPSPEDFYNVADQNSNMDIIDEELKKASEVAGKMTPEALGVYGYINTIGGGADLNSYLTTGSYRCTSTDAATVKNSPITTMAFQLHVFKAADKESSSESTRPTIQFITAVNTNDYGLYWRKHSSGVWTNWTELADANSRKIKSYTELSQLGLTSSATIADVFNALPNGGELLLDVATHNTSLYPLSQGTAHFTKRFGYRCFVEFYDYYGASQLNRIKRYYGLYNTATGFSGWHQYYDSYNEPGKVKITDFLDSSFMGFEHPTQSDMYIYKIGNTICGQMRINLKEQKTLSDLNGVTMLRLGSSYIPVMDYLIPFTFINADGYVSAKAIGFIQFTSGGLVRFFDISGDEVCSSVRITFSYPCA